MTRNDDTYDDMYDADDLMPTPTNIGERVALLGAGLLASAGLGGFAAARIPSIASLAPGVESIPHLLAASVLAFALGAGAFAMAFNLFTKSASRSQVKKVASVYLPVIGLLTALVDAGAFHPRLAMVFICLLCASGVVYAVFRGAQLMDFIRQNA